MPATKPRPVCLVLLVLVVLVLLMLLVLVLQVLVVLPMLVLQVLVVLPMLVHLLRMSHLMTPVVPTKFVLASAALAA